MRKISELNNYYFYSMGLTSVEAVETLQMAKSPFFFFAQNWKEKHQFENSRASLCWTPHTAMLKLLKHQDLQPKLGSHHRHDSSPR